MDRMEEAYRTLGLVYGAPKSDVKAAYKRLALFWHPDKNHSPNATVQFQRVNAAYQFICDNPFYDSSSSASSSARTEARRWEQYSKGLYKDAQKAKQTIAEQTQKLKSQSDELSQKNAMIHNLMMQLHKTAGSYKCEAPGCSRAYWCRKSLNRHTKAKHGTPEQRAKWLERKLRNKLYMQDRRRRECATSAN